MLDELLSTGEVIWSGQKKLGDDDGLVALHIQEYAAETLIVPQDSTSRHSSRLSWAHCLMAEPGSPISSAR
jgi:ATP-dependent Lhr-like helicase